MKSKEEIEQLLHGCFGEKEWTNVSNNAKLSLIQTYTQCQEDMADKKYTKEDVLKAGEIGEINHHDYKHIVSLLDEAKELNKQD